MAPLYCPGPEFMKRVFTTSTGDATIVVQKPAMNAAVKWHGMLSVENTVCNLVFKIHTDSWGITRGGAPTCHQVVFQDELFDDIICHQLGAVYDGITSYVWQKACKDGIVYIHTIHINTKNSKSCQNNKSRSTEELYWRHRIIFTTLRRDGQSVFLLNSVMT